MKVLFVEAPAVTFGSYVSAFREAGLHAEAAPDAQTALWRLAAGEFRVVVLPLTGAPLQWEVIAAASWNRPPARVIALARGPVDPGLRRRAHGAGVWEVGELPARLSGGGDGDLPALVPAVRRALKEAAPTALFVDDCGEMVEEIGALVAGEGMRFETAGTARTAAELMAAADYALIVTEACGPDHDGVEVMRAAARLQPGVPVVVLTASMDDGVFLRAVEMGASACLSKMAEPEEIAREILAVMRPERTQGSGRT